MCDGSAILQLTTRTTLEREVCLTGVMTIARVTSRRELVTSEAGETRSDGPVDSPMEFATAETPGGMIVELMERNENG